MGVVQLTLDDLVNEYVPFWRLLQQTTKYGSEGSITVATCLGDTYELPCRSYKRSIPLCICLLRRLSDFRGAERYFCEEVGKPEYRLKYLGMYQSLQTPNLPGHAMVFPCLQSQLPQVSPI